MTLPDVLTPTYVQMVEALSVWLSKAETQRSGADAGRLLSEHLAPDMFPLLTQIRFACVQEQEGVFRLRGEAFPPPVAILIDEGRNAADRPGSIAEARSRIAETVALVRAASADMPAFDPAMPIAHELPHGMVFDLTAEQYVRDWAVPQFYFHVMATYTILRAQGV